MSLASRRTFHTALLWAAAWLFASSCQAADGRNLAVSSSSNRVALVIGNDNYQQVTTLKNARTDAQAIANALEATGFRVILKLDASEKAMKEALRAFKGQVGGGDEAVFYYSGHGVQLGSTNYLLPVDIKGDNEDQVKDDAIPLQRVLDDLQDQKARFTLAIVDACRDNPFKKAGRAIGGRGLAPTTAATGQMVIYSAGTGQQALDRLGNDDTAPNGLFTRVFLKEMDKPGVPVDRVLRSVRDEVVRLARTVGHEQVPALYDQALGEFYFRPSAGAQVATLVPVPAAPSGAGVSLDDIRQQQEAKAKWDRWQAAMRADFDKVASLNAEPELMITAWDRFLANYMQKNPFSDDDERLRSEAKTRKQQAEAEKQRRTPSRPVGVSTTAGGNAFRDCADCPEMVVIPAGSFEMGSPSYEPGRTDDEDPHHRVNVRSFALGRTHVTRGQFAAFVNETGYQAGDSCWAGSKGQFIKRPGLNWRAPGFTQDDNHPAVCLNWSDAKAYVEWLSRKTGKQYRLPSEAEMEYAIRAGTTTARWWGESSDDACQHANVADRATKAQVPGASSWSVHNCADGYAHTAPVRSFKPNAYGLYDMIGNAWEWTEDCWHQNYNEAPVDGSAWMVVGRCGGRVLRGGSWYDVPQFARSAVRLGTDETNRSNINGFRLARTLP